MTDRDPEGPPSAAAARIAALESANHALQTRLDETNKIMWALYKELDDKNTELARSNEELDQFASIAGHDLQEPLRKVIAFGDRLDAEYGDRLDARGRDYITRMRGAAGRMLELLDDLLRYARVTSRARPFAKVSLDAVLNDVVADLETRIADEGGAVQVSPLQTIDADPIQMRQLFQNLIANGLKFHRPEVPPRVTISVAAAGDDDRVAVTVADNGIGLDPKFAERIFEPFRRLHGRAKFEGTGMGLAICRKIARRHGGDIRVESALGEGSRFVVTLPRRHAEAAGAMAGAGNGQGEADGDAGV